MSADLVIAAGIIYAVLLSIGRRREAIRYELRRLFFLLAIYLGVVIYLSQAGWKPPEAIGAGIVAGLLADTQFRRRSRYIPRSAKRKAIARFELETGKKYNPRKHELDHVIPFSKGGSNTGDNLRVVSRRENRSKGTKSPWWDFLGR